MCENNCHRASKRLLSRTHQTNLGLHRLPAIATVSCAPLRPASPSWQRAWVCTRVLSGDDTKLEGFVGGQTSGPVSNEADEPYSIRPDLRLIFPYLATNLRLWDGFESVASTVGLLRLWPVVSGSAALVGMRLI